MNPEVPNTFPTLLLAYSVIFGVLVCYLFVLAKKVGRLERELKSLNLKGSDSDLGPS